MQSVKQGSIKYHFLCLWYDSTWDWTQVFRAISEHLNYLGIIANFVDDNKIAHFCFYFDRLMIKDFFYAW